MIEHTIVGGGGVNLHVREAGNPKGRPLLFIHGLVAAHVVWRKQFESGLANSFRLVAMDLRGHGLSDKPRGAYGDSKLWADDVHAVITDLELEQPIVTGCSYGGFVVCDYLRFHGDADLGGIHLVDTFSQLGTEAALEVIGPEILALLPGFLSNDAEESMNALQAFMRLISHAELSLTDFFFLLGVGAIVPPHVRQGLSARTLDNDDLLRGIDVPVLITHGAEDAALLVTAAEQLEELIPHASLSIYPQVGHAPFFEAPDRFNRQLRRFALQ